MQNPPKQNIRTENKHSNLNLIPNQVVCQRVLLKITRALLQPNTPTTTEQHRYVSELTKLALKMIQMFELFKLILGWSFVFYNLFPPVDLIL
jgi:hypothetical protein